MAPESVHPILFHLGPLSLSSFGVMLAAGLLAALVLSESTAPLAGVSADRLWNAGLFVVIAAFVFSRGLLVISHWPTFVRFPLLVLALPSLTETGIALTVAATMLWLRAKQIPPRRALEAWMPCGLLVWGALALGHFAEGSDPGMPTTAAWGIRFPGASEAQQPVALIVAVLALGLGGVLYRRLGRGKPVAGMGLVVAGLGQVLISFLRQPSEASLAGLDSIEWVGLILAGVGGLLLLQDHRVKRE